MYPRLCAVVEAHWMQSVQGDSVFLSCCSAMSHSCQAQVPSGVFLSWPLMCISDK